MFGSSAQTAIPSHLGAASPVAPRPAVRSGESSRDEHTTPRCSSAAAWVNGSNPVSPPASVQVSGTIGPDRVGLVPDTCQTVPRMMARPPRRASHDHQPRHHASAVPHLVHSTGRARLRQRAQRQQPLARPPPRDHSPRTASAGNPHSGRPLISPRAGCRRAPALPGPGAAARRTASSRPRRRRKAAWRPSWRSPRRRG